MARGWPPLLLGLLGALLTLVAAAGLLVPGLGEGNPWRQWLLVLAALGPALLLLGGAWAMWRGGAEWRSGRGPGGVLTWAGLSWLSWPFLLLGAACWLTCSGDFGFSVSGTGVGWTFYYPSDLTEQWLTAAELLTLWLGPGLALLWWGRRLSRESV